MSTKANTNSKFGKQGWIIIIFGFFCWFFSNALNDSMNSLYPYFMEARGWERTTMATYVSVGNWLGMIVILGFAAAARKLGAKRMLMIGFGLLSVSWIGLTAANTVTVFGICMIGNMLGVSAITGFGVQLLGANWFPKKKGLYMGWTTMGVVACVTVINQIVQAFLRGPGVKYFFILFAACDLIMLIIAAIAIKNTPEEAGAFPDNDQSFDYEEQKKIAELGKKYAQTSPITMKSVLGDKNTWFLALGWGLLTYTMSAVFGHIVGSFISFGYDPSFPVALMTYMFPFGLFFSWFGGWWDAKWGTKHVSMWLVSVLSVIGCLLVYFGYKNMACCTIGVGIFMGCMSAGNNVLMGAVSSRYGRYDFAAAWPYIYIITKVIAGFGPMSFSMIADATGDFRVAYLVIAIVSALAFILIGMTDLTCVGRTDEDIKKMLGEQAV